MYYNNAFIKIYGTYDLPVILGPMAWDKQIYLGQSPCNTWHLWPGMSRLTWDDLPVILGTYGLE